MRTKYFCPAFMLVLLMGCSAPHDNPHDPSSPHYRAPVPEPDLWVRVRSEHIARNTLPETYTVVAELGGADAPRMDSVWVSFDGRPAVPLDRIDDSWATLFTASYFGDPRLSTVIGRPFYFTALDPGGVRHTAGPAYMWRVILETPVLISPRDSAAVGAQPLLVWQPFTALRQFTYTVVVSLAGGAVVWSDSTFPSSVQSAQVPEALAAGLYFWTLAVVDPFGNSSRSREGVFRVVP